CTWGFGGVWKWGGSMANMWRTTGDISPSWNRIMRILDSQKGMAKYQGPGGWNDPDMLEVGVSPLTDTESQAHFTMWAMLSAPLIAGNDLRGMSQPVRDILMNPEVIAIDQDPAGVPARLVTKWRNQPQVWVKPLAAAGEYAVAVLNRDDSDASA